jgi:predicted deacylase
VLVCALTHGNEICGAITLDQLFGAGVRPRRGRLTLAFDNIAAYREFDARYPIASRYIDEDFNRLWHPATLDGPRRSVELERARALRPIVDSADFLLDLHSMQYATAPLMLAGLLPRSRALAQRIGIPELIMCDAGHAAGPRMRDYGGFGDPKSPKNALLIETGQHWRASSVVVAKDVTARFLAESGIVEAADLPAGWKQPTPPKQRVVEVTHAIATKRGNFKPARRFEGQEVIAKAGTVLGLDEGEAVTTPYDNCVLVMPSSNRPLRAGVTVVRLGRLV